MIKNLQFPSSLFVAGTDTDVGKTFVSAILASGLQARYWKPVQCGILPETDTEWIGRMADLPAQDIVPEAFRLANPLSPHLAARLQDVKITVDDILAKRPADNGKKLIVEGAGGLLVPLNENELFIDLIEKLALPVVLVSRTALGTINHTLLSIMALRQRGIEPFGVVMNGAANEENVRAVEKYGKVKVLGCVPRLYTVSPETVTKLFAQCFNG